MRGLNPSRVWYFPILLHQRDTHTDVDVACNLPCFSEDAKPFHCPSAIHLSIGTSITHPYCPHVHSSAPMPQFLVGLRTKTKKPSKMLSPIPAVPPPISSPVSDNDTSPMPYQTPGPVVYGHAHMHFHAHDAGAEARTLIACDGTAPSAGSPPADKISFDVFDETHRVSAS